jgi:predicted RNase H-like HicB family nuclease
MKKFKNTLQKGEIRFIIFKEEGTWYGVALEFNIVEQGENPQDVLLRTFQAAEGYLESAKKIKARPHVLNQNVDPEWESLWNKLEAKKGVPYDIYSYGRQLIPA